MDGEVPSNEDLLVALNRARIAFLIASGDVITRLGNIAATEDTISNDGRGFADAVGEMTLAITRKIGSVNSAVIDVFDRDRADVEKGDVAGNDDEISTIEMPPEHLVISPKIGDVRNSTVLSDGSHGTFLDVSETETTVPPSTNTRTLSDTKKSESIKPGDIRLKIYYFFSDRDTSKSVISQIFESSAEEKSTLTRNNLIKRITRYLKIDKNKLKQGYLINFYEGLEALEDDFLVRDHRPAQGDEKARICYYLKTPPQEQS